MVANDRNALYGFGEGSLGDAPVVHDEQRSIYLFGCFLSKLPREYQ